jgi:hypothetical protein
MLIIYSFFHNTTGYYAESCSFSYYMRSFWIPVVEKAIRGGGGAKVAGFELKRVQS